MAFIHRAGLLPLLFILIFCTCGRAQIINIEDKRKALDSLGRYGQLDVNGSLTRNNNTVVTAGGASPPISPIRTTRGSTGTFRRCRLRCLIG